MIKLWVKKLIIYMIIIYIGAIAGYGFLTIVSLVW